MFGHTHSDDFRVVTSIEDNKPIGVLTVCGAVSTWIGRNPSFCVYEVDKDTLLPVKRYTQAFDVE